MDKNEYVKLCTALYGQPHYTSFVNAEPQIYRGITQKPEPEVLYFQHPDDEKGRDEVIIHGYECPLYSVQDNSIINEYKLTPGYEKNMVFLVKKVNNKTSANCIILEMIVNIFKIYINDLF